MTRDQIVDAVRVTLRDHMGHPHLAGFGTTARLNEDLCLDSILMLNLFLNLELEFGLAAPEEALGRRALATVDDLADLFDPAREHIDAAPAQEIAPGEGVHGEEYVDIKVHCFVSCVCAALKAAGIDHRPFYFGVWDADFAVTDAHALAYHAASVSHDFFKGWFERLYGPALDEWYDPGTSQEQNVATLLDLVARRPETGAVMVMLDMFHLPERENKFSQNPFPHYLMVEETADAYVWRVLDPDFRWEGLIARDRVLHAVRQPTVGGGYVFDRSHVRPAADADVAEYFEACFLPARNPLIQSVRRIVDAHLGGRAGVRLADLGTALAELPVISIRKYAYEHGFAFFWRALRLDAATFDRRCDEIEDLVQGLKGLHYQALKLGRTGDRTLAPALFEELDRLDGLERAIKRELGDAFALWRADRGLRVAAPIARRAGA